MNFSGDRSDANLVRQRKEICQLHLETCQTNWKILCNQIERMESEILAAAGNSYSDCTLSQKLEQLRVPRDCRLGRDCALNCEIQCGLFSVSAFKRLLAEER
jgi:hypothetical protein